MLRTRRRRFDAPAPRLATVLCTRCVCWFARSFVYSLVLRCALRVWPCSRRTHHTACTQAHRAPRAVCVLVCVCARARVPRATTSTSQPLSAAAPLAQHPRHERLCTRSVRHGHRRAVGRVPRVSVCARVEEHSARHRGARVGGGGAPWRGTHFAHARCPASARPTTLQPHAAAQWSGVHPSTHLAFTSAPASRKRRTCAPRIGYRPTGANARTPTPTSTQLLRNARGTPSPRCTPHAAVSRCRGGCPKRLSRASRRPVGEAC